MVMGESGQGNENQFKLCTVASTQNPPPFTPRPPNTRAKATPQTRRLPSWAGGRRWGGSRRRSTEDAPRYTPSPSTRVAPVRTPAGQGTVGSPLLASLIMTSTLTARGVTDVQFTVLVFSIEPSLDVLFFISSLFVSRGMSFCSDDYRVHAAVLTPCTNINT